VVGNAINMFARAAKAPNAVLNEAPDALIQAPLSSIANAAAPYTGLFTQHIRGTAIKEGNAFVDAQHEVTRAGQTASGYTPPEPVTIDPITGAPSNATLTTPPDLPGGSPSPMPTTSPRTNPFGGSSPAQPKASSALPVNPNQADIDDLNRQIQIRESMIEDGSLSGDDAASAQREVDQMRRDVRDLSGEPVPTAAEKPIKREGFFGPSKTPGVYETNPNTGQVTFTPSGKLSDDPLFEPKAPTEAAPTVTDAGPVGDPFAGFGGANEARAQGDFYEVNEVGQITFDPDRLRQELVLRQEELAQIDARLEESAIGTLRGELDVTGS
jgi:hypothetical protein